MLKSFSWVELMLFASISLIGSLLGSGLAGVILKTLGKLPTEKKSRKEHKVETTHQRITNWMYNMLQHGAFLNESRFSSLGGGRVMVYKPIPRSTQFQIQVGWEPKGAIVPIMLFDVWVELDCEVWVNYYQSCRSQFPIPSPRLGSNPTDFQVEVFGWGVAKMLLNYPGPIDK